MHPLLSPSVVVIFSADAEWNAARKFYPNARFVPFPYGEYFLEPVGGQQAAFTRGGWGKISAAASTQYAIDRFQLKLLINLGTCGGFAGSIHCGQIILVKETVVYDLWERMFDPNEAIRYYSTKLDLSWFVGSYPQPVILGRLVSADRDIDPVDIPMLKKKYHAIAADWESGSIAWVAKRNKIPCLILRTVSDLTDDSGGSFDKRGGDFNEKAEGVITNLLKALPGWLGGCKKLFS